MSEPKLKEQISFETSCMECSHQLVCHGDRAKLCVNYEIDTKTKCYYGCQSCINNDAKKSGGICFKCSYFNSKGR
jgi:hypothetical protein